MTLTEVEMGIDTIVDLVRQYRGEADYTLHEFSHGRPGDPEPCTDYDVLCFMTDLDAGVPASQLVISRIEWEESGGCAGDALYDVTLAATKLPDDRYFLELDGYGIHREFVYSVQMTEREVTLCACEPQVGDFIVTNWHDGERLFSIDLIGPDKTGVSCAHFGRDGIISCEAISSLRLKLQVTWAWVQKT